MLSVRDCTGACCGLAGSTASPLLLRSRKDEIGTA